MSSSAASSTRPSTIDLNTLKHGRPPLWRQLIRDRWAFASVLFLLAIALMAVFAHVLIPWDINLPDYSARLLPPLSPGHPAGTDQMGRDVLARVIYGARISLTVGFATVIIAAVLGVFVGMLAGFYGGWLDTVLMRLVDVQLSFPFILLALTLNAIIGLGLRNIIISLVLAGWVEFARVARGETLVVREKEFVQSARLVGCSNIRILRLHILPNIVTPLIVVATLQVAQFIIAEASISFLGFGVQPPTPAWGSMLSESLDYIFSGWWLITIPGLLLGLVALAVNITGDWLRDTLDPRLVV